MAPFRWRDQHIPKFLKLYKEHECLWNMHCNSGYKNKRKRAASYETICAEMGIPELTVYDVKAKIKSIRTSYKFELNKIMHSVKSGVGIDNLYVTKLFWFPQADSFLRGVSIVKENSSCLTSQTVLPESEQQTTDNSSGKKSRLVSNSFDKKYSKLVDVKLELCELQKEIKKEQLRQEQIKTKILEIELKKALNA